MKQLFFLLFFAIANSIFSQFSGISNDTNSNGQVRNIDSVHNEITVKLNGKTKYTDYKVISAKNDTTFVDTTLTIKKEYKFNFRRKDNFELLEFHNQGLTFTTLAHDFSNVSLSPDIGNRAKQFLYMNVEDINYYQVPTPTSEILYRTGLQQGQVLDALFTLNFSKRLNASVAYKGLRSLGHYRQSLASNGNFRTTVSYRSKNDQYHLKSHVTFQDFWNEESGGLPEESIEFFESNDEDFEDRGDIDVNLDDAENKFIGTRFYLDHNYQIFSSKDSTNQKNISDFKIGHVFNIEKKTYQFKQSTATVDIFGETYNSGSINEKSINNYMNNQAYLEFNSKYILGRLKAKANYTTISHKYNSVYNSNVSTDIVKLSGNAVAIGAEWKAKINNFEINADANLTPGQGYLAGRYLKGEALFTKDSLFKVKGSLLLSSKAPNFNFQLLHSNYIDYNWKNSFDNINTRNLGFDAISKWGNASLNLTNIEDYTYFDTINKPQQYKNSIVYLKLKVNKEFKYKKFALDNTIMYQNVSSGSDVFRVPELISRNTLYYSDHWFKGDPLQVQIGTTFKYFTKYKANAYNPFLAEFTLQDTDEIGNYPSIDVFVNARVRRTRIYFKIDNVTSGFTGRNYYSAPSYPYRDFVIRFGLVWNWFI